MKPRVKLFHVLLSLALVSWCHGGEIKLVPSVQRIDLNEGTLEFNGDLQDVNTFSFGSLTYAKTDSYTNDLPGGEVWIGATGPFSCIIVVAEGGAIAAHFTDQASNYEMFSDATGQLFVRTSDWEEVPIVYTEKEAANRNSLNGPIQGKLFGHKVGDRRQRHRDLQTKTVVKALVPILRRATCEQALLAPDCQFDDASRRPIEARLILIQAQVNAAMDKSGIPVEVLMRTWMDIPDFDVDASSNLVDELETSANIATWRSQAQADLVIMITGSLNGDYGVASRISGFASAVSYNSLSYLSAPNVVGNSFGARPSRFDVSLAAQHEYGNGFEVPSRLSTVASHGCGPGFPCPIVNSYSSPDISYVMGDGLSPDPLTMGNAANNNARIISEQAQSVADFNKELPNDLCAEEVSTVTNGPFTTSGAIPDYNAVTCDGVEVTGPSVWFTVVGNGLTQTFSTCEGTNFNTKISVYSGSCDNLGCVVANIDGGCSGGSQVSWPSTLGAKYFILVHGVENESGDFEAQFFARPTAAPTFAPTPTPVAPTPPTPTPPSPPNGTPVPAPPELCFSDSNTVIERDEGVISIDEVKVGDFLLTPRGTYSMVYSLAHYKADLEADFIQVYTGCREPLEVSGNHLVFVNGTPTRASRIQVGDYLGNEVVTTLAEVKRRGVFAPLTVSGDLMVSGVRASSYVGLMPDSGVVLNQHVLGHLLFSPIRMLCRWDLRYCSSETHDEVGYSNIYSWLIRFLVWIGHQGATVSLPLSAIATPFLFVLWLVELSLSSHWGVTVAAVIATTWWVSRPPIKATQQTV